MLRICDGIRLPAMYTSSFDSNVSSLNVLLDDMAFMYSINKGFLIEDYGSDQIVYKVQPRDALYILPSPTLLERAQVAMRRPGNTAKDWYEKSGNPRMGIMPQSN